MQKKMMFAAVLSMALSAFAQNDGYAEYPQQNNDGYNQGYAQPQQYNNGYAQPQPVYGQPQQYNNGYAQPQPVYGQPQQYNNGYAQPQQGYAQPQQYNNGYAQPQPVYGQPQPYNNGYAQPQPVYAPAKANPGKSLQTLNFVIPIENETWDIDDLGDVEWSSVGFEFSWTRYRINENGYSSVFGLSLGYISGEAEPEKSSRSIDMEGMDFNLKFGWGMAPVMGDVNVALHILMGVDFKMLENDDFRIGTSESSNSVEYSATYFDIMLGGDMVVAFQMTESFGLIAGVDVTTNIFGLGVLSLDADDWSTDDSWGINYLFSGINIVPHIGLAFIF